MKVLFGVLGAVGIVIGVESLLLAFDQWDGVWDSKNIFIHDTALPFDLTAGGKIPLRDVRLGALLPMVSGVTAATIGGVAMRYSFR